MSAICFLPSLFQPVPASLLWPLCLFAFFELGYHNTLLVRLQSKFSPIFVRFYSDYEAARQSSLFEDVVSYDSTDGQFPGDGSEPPGTISVAAAGPPNGELMEGSNNGT